MKVLNSRYVTAVQSGTTWLAYLLKITRRDAQVFAFTSAPRNLKISGTNYLSAQGLDISTVVTSIGLAVDNLELTTIDDQSVFTIADILTRRWSNAIFSIARCHYDVEAGYGFDLDTNVEFLMAGTLGDVQLRRGHAVVELRGWQQYLAQPMGIVTSPTCRARLGDALCTINLATWTVTGALDDVISRNNVGDSTRAEADEYFVDGAFTFTTGDNAGLSQKVKVFAAGYFTFALPFVFDPQVGDEYSVYAGCRKRFVEDCKNKFNNVLNFQGEPHLPGLDRLTKPAT